MFSQTSYPHLPSEDAVIQRMDMCLHPLPKKYRVVSLKEELICLICLKQMTDIFRSPEACCYFEFCISHREVPTHLPLFFHDFVYTNLSSVTAFFGIVLCYSVNQNLQRHFRFGQICFLKLLILIYPQKMQWNRGYNRWIIQDWLQREGNISIL